MSRILSPRQMTGLNKLGDAFIPGDEIFPSFSQLGCSEHADAVISHIPPEDQKDLKLLLTLISFWAPFFVRSLISFLEISIHLPGPIGAFFRTVRFGIKGVVVSLYYSGRKGKKFTGKTPLELIGYNVEVYRGDLEKTPS